MFETQRAEEMGDAAHVRERLGEPHVVLATVGGGEAFALLVEHVFVERLSIGRLADADGEQIDRRDGAHHNGQLVAVVDEEARVLEHAMFGQPLDDRVVAIRR